MTTGVQTYERTLLAPFVDSLTCDVEVIGHLFGRERATFRVQESFSFLKPSETCRAKRVIRLQCLDGVWLLKRPNKDLDIRSSRCCFGECFDRRVRDGVGHSAERTGCRNLPCGFVELLQCPGGQVKQITGPANRLIGLSRCRFGFSHTKRELVVFQACANDHDDIRFRNRDAICTHFDSVRRKRHTRQFAVRARDSCGYSPAGARRGDPVDVDTLDGGSGPAASCQERLNLLPNGRDAGLHLGRIIGIVHGFNASTIRIIGKLQKWRCPGDGPHEAQTVTPVSARSRAVGARHGTQTMAEGRRGRTAKRPGEPGLFARQARAAPKRQYWSGRVDSNHRPLGPEPSALPG